MTIDGGMQEVVTVHRVVVLALHSAAFVSRGVAVAHGAAQHAPATAGRYLSQLLDVDMNQLPAPDLLHPAHYPSSGPVQPTQPGQPITGEYSMHGGRVQAQQIADSRWSPAPQHPDLDDPPLGTSRSSSWVAIRTRWPAAHPSLTQVAVPPRPAGRRSHRHLESFSGSPQRPTVLNDTTSQPEAARF